MKRIVILGVGGNCVDILDTLRDINREAGRAVYECAGFLDDNRETWETDIHGAPCLGGLDTARQHTDCHFVNGIGSPAGFWKKREIIARTGLTADRFETIVHPTAAVSSMATLGRGVVVFQQVTITNHVTVGDHVIILPNSVISHDVRIGDYTCIAGGVCISGGVEIEQSCYLGSNCTLNNDLRIGEYSLVGMGAVVLTDVPRNCVVVGNPAKVLRKTSEGL